MALRAVGLGRVRVAPPAHPIKHVLGHSARVKVIRTHTRRVVAVVAYVEPVRNGSPIRNDPREPMRPDVLAEGVEIAVAASGLSSHPNPATFIGLGYARPESLLDLGKRFVSRKSASGFNQPSAIHVFTFQFSASEGASSSRIRNRRMGYLTSSER